MKINWNYYNNDSFSKILPKISQLYFGSKLIVDKNAEKERFFLNSKDSRMLAIAYDDNYSSVEKKTMIESWMSQSGAAAGLIVSRFPQPFEFKLVQTCHCCWFPIAIWGRHQVDAIASMNTRALALDKIVQFKEPYFKKNYTSNARSMGKGAALWSDIIEFENRSHNIGQTISMDPIKVQREMFRHVNTCFNWSGGRDATFRTKVGADGWFYFFSDPDSAKVVNLAIDCTNHIRRLPGSNALYRNYALTLATGINTVENLQLEENQPHDDDSVTAYYLTKQSHSQFDIRATDNAVTNLVSPLKRSEWNNYGVVNDPMGMQINVFGHS
jgi:hypothetical protein